MKQRKEGYVFYSFVSLLYVGSALQVLYGTAVLSSLAFLSVRDAIIVALRYMASTLVSRVVLVYEFAGMRGMQEIPDEWIELADQDIQGQ